MDDIDSAFDLLEYLAEECLVTSLRSRERRKVDTPSTTPIFFTFSVISYSQKDYGLSFYFFRRKKKKESIEQFMAFFVI